MYGVLLAGGLASRLGPITRVTNKHLLPIYDKPLIFYGIETLRDLGCEKIVIILGGNSVGDIVNLVRDGSQFGVEVVYKFQNEPKGISHAIGLAEDIIVDEHNETTVEKFLVLLGDNIFSNGSSLKKSINMWERNRSSEAAIFLTSVKNPHEYGQPILIDEGTKVQKFVEKDPTVDHNLIVTGLYGFNDLVFEFTINKQQPSLRGEFEVTDTLTALLPSVDVFHYEGFWSDCGTPEGLALATQHMLTKKGGERNANNN